MQSNIDPHITNFDEELFVDFYSQITNNEIRSGLTNIRK